MALLRRGVLMRSQQLQRLTGCVGRAFLCLCAVAKGSCDVLHHRTPCCCVLASRGRDGRPSLN